MCCGLMMQRCCFFVGVLSQKNARQPQVPSRVSVPLVFGPTVVNWTTTLCCALDSFSHGPLAAVLFLKRIPSFVMRIISVPVIAIVMGCVSVPVPAPFSVCLNHSAFLAYTGSPLRCAGCLGCSCQVPSFLISTVLLLFAQDLLSVKGESS